MRSPWPTADEPSDYLRGWKRRAARPALVMSTHLRRMRLVPCCSPKPGHLLPVLKPSFQLRTAHDLGPAVLRSPPSPVVPASAIRSMDLQLPPQPRYAAIHSVAAAQAASFIRLLARATALSAPAFVRSPLSAPSLLRSWTSQLTAGPVLRATDSAGRARSQLRAACFFRS